MFKCIIVETRSTHKLIGCMRNTGNIESSTIEVHNSGKVYWIRRHGRSLSKSRILSKLIKRDNISKENSEDVGLNFSNFCRCDRITNIGLQYLSDCPELRGISLEDVYSVTNAYLSILVKKCPLLHYVYLSGCMRIKGDGFKVIGGVMKS